MTAIQFSFSFVDLPSAPASLRDYDWIVISSSAGKDSQAMLETVYQRAEQEGCTDRIVVVHCDLGRVEWPGARDLAERQAAAYGVRFVATWRQQGDLLSQVEGRGKWPGPATRFCTAHHKTNQVSRVFTGLANETRANESRTGDLLSHVEQRGMWPSPRQRYCTSDHKRAQVHRVLTALAQTTATKRPTTKQPVRILSCMGMRADESPARAKKRPFAADPVASNGRRQVDCWLPLHAWTEEQVWTCIRASRQADLIHPAYALGMPRLSCCFCIFAPKAALVLAGRHNPELLAEYVRVETKIGHTFRVDLSLQEVQRAVNFGDVEAGDQEQVATWQM